MKALRLYRIKLRMSLLILGLFALYLSLATISRIHSEQQSYVQLTEEHLSHDLSDMQGRFEQDPGIHQIDELRHHIVVYGARKRILTMALTDPKTDQILAATHSDIEGRPASDNLVHFEQRVAREVVASGAPRIVLRQGFRHLHAYFPVRLVNGSTPGPQNYTKAVLYATYNVGPSYSQIWCTADSAVPCDRSIFTRSPSLNFTPWTTSASSL